MARLALASMVALLDGVRRPANSQPDAEEMLKPEGDENVMPCNWRGAGWSPMSHECFCCMSGLGRRLSDNERPSI